MIKLYQLISTTLLTSAILIAIGRSPPPQAQETIIPPVSPNSTYLAQRQNKLVQAVDTIGITVSDMDRSIAFYSEALSFTKISDIEVYGEEYEQLLGNAFITPPVNYVVTVPGKWGVIVALIAEFILSLGLMLMVLFTSNNNRLSPYTGIFAGIMVATYITLEAPISGMSINPARTFASALPSQIWTDFWIYYFAPSLAMLLAAEIYLRYPKKPKTICYKLCPNNQQPCIATQCCNSCE